MILADGVAANETARRAGTPPVPVPTWQHAVERASAALLAGERFVTVTGPPGTGKTELLLAVATRLRTHRWQVWTGAARLRTNPDPDDIDTQAARPTAWLIDDAHRLSDAGLHALQQWLGGGILLVGTSDFLPRGPADGPGRTRIALAPLSPAEIDTYVAYYLAQAHQDPARLDRRARQKLAELSAGVPRLLAALLATALRHADIQESIKVTAQHVDDAAWHHIEHAAAHQAGLLAPPSTPAPRTAYADDRDDEPNPRNWLRATAGFTAALVLTAAAGLALTGHWPGTVRPNDTPPPFQHTPRPTITPNPAPPPENAPENAPEYAPENAPENAPAGALQGAPASAPAVAPAVAPENTTQLAPENAPENAPEPAPQVEVQPDREPAIDAAAKANPPPPAAPDPTPTPDVIATAARAEIATEASDRLPDLPDPPPPTSVPTVSAPPPPAARLPPPAARPSRTAEPRPDVRHHHRAPKRPTHARRVSPSSTPANAASDPPTADSDQ